MAKYSPEKLKRLNATFVDTPDPRPSTPQEPAPLSAPDNTAQIEVLIRGMSAMSEAQLSRIAQVMEAIRDKIDTPAQTLEFPSPKPCTLKVKRDSKGFIDSIDVLPQE